MVQFPGISRRSLFLLAAICVSGLVAQNGGKRPLTHRDYDAWKSIASQRLSDDGVHLAYMLVPQEGDSEVVLKNLQTGAEKRFNAGARPAPAGGAAESEPGEPTTPSPGAGPGGLPRGGTVSFTSDSKYLIFTTYAPKAAQDQARKERKRPDEMPKGALKIVTVATGDAASVPGIRSFQTAESNAQWLAYLKEPPAPAPTAAGAAKKENDQRRGAGAAAAGAGGAQRPTLGSDLTLRDLNGGAEKTFADVTEYSLSKDGADLLYTVSSKQEESNGVYSVATSSGEPKALLGGKGRYQRLAWDEKQTQAVFLSSRDDAAARQPKYKIYHWTRGATAAAALADAEMAGVPRGWVISDRAAVSFAKDGNRLFFGTAPAAPARPAAGVEAQSNDKPVADLWHWKDDNVQPMQKVRAEQERNRSYRAVIGLRDKKIVQLADATMSDLTLSEDTNYGIGSDDREYKQLVEYDERHSDQYWVDVATGARKLLLRAHRGTLSPSPDNKWAVTFNGKDWLSIEVANGRSRNLTESFNVAFGNEDYDMTGTRNSYGMAGFTKDSKYVLLYDRYDVWQVSPDGSGARMLTDGQGRLKKIQFRYVKLGDEETPAVGGRGGFGGSSRNVIDPAKPVLLRAEHLETRETGFWEDRVDGSEPPKQLIMAAKSFGTPAKAKKADVLILTASRFDEFGDVLVTNAKFESPRKVTSANPQKAQFAWGKAELIRYRNQDGVELQAALYKPDNFDPSKKYPMMVYIYERLSQGVHRFVTPAPSHSVNISYYVSNGYVVLTPDIAYTLGYPGESALKCVIPAIQAVVDKGGINEDAIGIQGHSWGGYQIAYMITQTKRFKAASAGAPVANMISAYDGIRWGSGLPRQFQYERSQSRIGGSIWQYPLRFIENSPIFHADKVRTPLLMLHNDNDDAVPWYQGVEYFLALRRLGREVYLFNYNGEPHGIRKRPNQKDYTMRLQQFFDYHLKGAPMPDWMQRGIPYLEREQEKEKWIKSTEPAVSGAQ